MSNRKTIVLTMIVRNEVAVIERCLASVRPIIDYWSIVDTGSTDGTQAKIHQAMAGIPGELLSAPKSTFDVMRTNSLVCARGKADYHLVIDADDILQYDPDFVMPELTADIYELLIQDTGISYKRPHIFRADLPFKYVGVVHEYLDCDAKCGFAQFLPGITYRRFLEGSRGYSPAKYVADAKRLREALVKDPTNARNVFYLAQSLRDAKRPREALNMYRKRSEMKGGWVEETWRAHYECGLLHMELGDSDGQVIDAFLRAFQYRPERIEPLYDLARYHRFRNCYYIAYMFAVRGVRQPRPDEQLFLDDSVYAWRMLEEYAIAAYFVGEKDKSFEAYQELLMLNIPSSDMDRIQSNMRFFSDRRDPVPYQVL